MIVMKVMYVNLIKGCKVSQQPMKAALGSKWLATVPVVTGKINERERG